MQIIRIKELIKLIGLSRSGIYERMNPESPRYDPTFPKKVKLGSNAIGFVKSEIEAWVQTRIDERDTIATHS